MARFELKLPKMGESVAEATITSWLKDIGDSIEEDEPILEIATDKVDSEVPSEVNGTLVEVLFNVDDIIQVGQTIAIIEIEGDANEAITTPKVEIKTEVPTPVIAEVEKTVVTAQETAAPVASTGERFYSPLVKNMAKAEGISQAELDNVPGKGKEGRVTKADMQEYIANRSSQPKQANTLKPTATSGLKAASSKSVSKKEANPLVVGEGDVVIELSRMGKIIANHMMDSLQTSAHVQSFIEADVTDVWNWRKKVKADFHKREGENLTFTPIFMEAIAKALRDYPLMNIALQGDTVIKKKNINLGMAAALPDGNLIVPVIKNADQLNLVGMAKQVNDLAKRAREGKLAPDDIQDGTYTVTNVGTFGSIMGTPIINQPQVGILALGVIRKVPAVIETPDGDFIAIRYRMYLSHSYDHRVVNGALGGLFVKAVKDYLESWDVNREI